MEDIANAKEIDAVILNGRYYSEKVLKALLEELKRGRRKLIYGRSPNKKQQAIKSYIDRPLLAESSRTIIPLH